MPRKQIKDLIAELRSWLPDYDHGPKDYPTILYRVLATVPGGEELEDMGYEPIGEHFGWHELDQLGRVLTTIESERDVQDLIAGLTAEEDDESEVGETVAETYHTSEASIQRPTNDRLFIGVFPGGISYADKSREKHGDYANCAFLSFDTLQLEFRRDCPVSLRKQIEDSAAKIQARRGEEYPIDASGHTVILGGSQRARETVAEEAPRSEPANEDTAHELALYTINDGDIYRRNIQPIIKNLANKIRNGTYDKEKAVQAWVYAADAGAQKYTKEFGGSGNGSYGSFTKADRMEAAKEIAEQYDEELQAAAKPDRRLNEAPAVSETPTTKERPALRGRRPSRKSRTTRKR